VRSMTGYGAASAEAATARVAVEVRSVNQRFLDVRVTLPREYVAWEREVRDRVRAAAARGRVEVAVSRAPVAGERRYAVSVRTELARAYVDAARRLARTLRLPAEVALADVLRLPDLFEVSERPPDLRGERPALRKAVAAALRAFDADRRREGAHLAADMRQRTAALQKLTADVRRRLPHAMAALRRQVDDRLARAIGGADVDPARVAQEVAVLADRSDVTEEIVRLASHLGALAAALREPGPVGKRIEFLLQEIHRELNTTGSKADDTDITTLVLTGKGELEKLREQVQNVE
jgi:uncharacterized protein (TIGR00255 family)